MVTYTVQDFTAEITREHNAPVPGVDGAQTIMHRLFGFGHWIDRQPAGAWDGRTVWAVRTTGDGESVAMIFEQNTF